MDWLMDNMLVIFAAVLWLFCGLAVVMFLAGDPEAINGILGAGVSAIVVTACAWLARD